MAMPLDSFEAAIPEPFRILGLRLKPLSLGRYRILNRFGCAFVADEKSGAGARDLVTGALICSMSCDEFLGVYGTRRFRKLLKAWYRKFCPAWWHFIIPRRWRQRRNKRFADLILEAIKLFQEYIDEGSRRPDYFIERENAVSGAHWSHSVEVALRSEVGWTKEEIDEAPLTKALNDYFKHAESQGAIRLMTAEEIEQGKANAKVYAQLLAATN